MWRPDLPIWQGLLILGGLAFGPAILAGLFGWWVTGRFLWKDQPRELA